MLRSPGGANEPDAARRSARSHGPDRDRSPIQGRLARRRIREAVALEPGLSMSELSDAVGLAAGTLTYHVRRLEAQGDIRRCRVGRRVHLYSASLPDRYARWDAVLRDDASAAILRCLLDARRWSVAQLARAVGQSSRTTRRRVQHLVDANLAEAEGEVQPRFSAADLVQRRHRGLALASWLHARLADRAGGRAGLALLTHPLLAAAIRDCFALTGPEEEMAQRLRAQGAEPADVEILRLDEQVATRALEVLREIRPSGNGSGGFGPSVDGAALAPPMPGRRDAVEGGAPAAARASLLPRGAAPAAADGDQRDGEPQEGGPGPGGQPPDPRGCG